MLFLDLQKAFDRVIRELVFNFPESEKTNPKEYLIGLGVSDSSATWIT